MIIGYARILTGEEDAVAQCDALESAGCARIVVEKSKGNQIDYPRRDALLSELVQGDVLVVECLHRLDLSMPQLNELVRDLTDRGASLLSLTEKVDTADANSALIIQMIDVLAGMENARIVERTQAGIAAARKRGVPIGRPHILSTAQIDHARQRIEDGQSVSAIARAFGVSRLTLKRAIERTGEKESRIQQGGNP